MSIRKKAQLPSVNILGSKVNLLNTPQVIDIMEEWINSENATCRQIIVSGFHGILEGHKDTKLKNILNSADLWVPDGIAPVAVARLKGHKNVSRTPGAEIMESFLEVADKKGYSSYFYGDTDDTLEKLKTNLQIKYPGHRIAGMYSPPFRSLTNDEDDAIVEFINKTNPDIVWVGLGTPKQDRWGFTHKDKLNTKIVIGVGAAFGFLAGKVQRVPKWIGNSGFEWVWRFAMEPKKLWRRDIIDGPRFLWYVGLELMNIKKYDYKQD